MAWRMFGLPQKSTNNDREFLQLLDSYRMENPDNSLYMEALRLEISRIVAGFDQVIDKMVIFVYCQQEGSLGVPKFFRELNTVRVMDSYKQGQQVYKSE